MPADTPPTITGSFFADRHTLSGPPKPPAPVQPTEAAPDHGDWVSMIVGELKELFPAGTDVLVAGQTTWLPEDTERAPAATPDVLVAFGRPRGSRGVYRQWQEGHVAPHVVFEVQASDDGDDQLDELFAFYQDHGVEEYYLIDPRGSVEGYRRRGARLVPVRGMDGYASPRLGVTFKVDGESVQLVTPDGRVFQNREDRVRGLEERIQELTMQVEDEKHRASSEARRADTERRLREALAAQLRQLGVDPDASRRAA